MAEREVVAPTVAPGAASGAGGADDVVLGEPEPSPEATAAAAALEKAKADEAAGAEAAAEVRGPAGGDSAGAVASVLELHGALVSLLGGGEKAEAAAAVLIDLPPASLQAVLGSLRSGTAEAKEAGARTTAAEVIEERKARAVQDEVLAGDEAWAELTKAHTDGKQYAETLPDELRKGLRAQVAEEMLRALSPLRTSVLKAREDAAMARLLEEHPQMRDASFSGDVRTAMAAMPGLDVTTAIKLVRGARAEAELAKRVQADQFRDAGHLATWQLAGGGGTPGAPGTAPYVPMPKIPAGGLDTTDVDALLRMAVGTAGATEEQMEALRARNRQAALAAALRFADDG